MKTCLQPTRAETPLCNSSVPARVQLSSLALQIPHFWPSKTDSCIGNPAEPLLVILPRLFRTKTTGLGQGAASVRRTSKLKGDSGCALNPTMLRRARLDTVSHADWISRVEL